MLRSFINTFLALLCFITLFLTGALQSVNASSCPIGNTPTLKWPLGTSAIASACVAGCRAEEGHNGQSTWTCSQESGYCTGYFVTTGETCDGSDNTNGTCDANGNCTGSGGSGGNTGTNADIQRVLDQMPVEIQNGRDSAHVFKSLGMLQAYTERTLQPAVQHLNQVELASKETRDNTRRTYQAVELFQSTLSRIDETISNDSSRLGSIDNWLRNIHDKIETGSTGGSGLPDEQFSELMGGIGSLHSSIFNANSTTASAVRDVRNGLRPIEFELQDINRNMETLGNSLTANATANTDKLLEAINGLGGTGGDSDLSGVQSGIDAINTGLDNLNGLLNGNGLNKPSTGSGVNFGEVPLYGSEALEGLNTEITDLQNQYSEKIKEFQKLFSFDTSKLNNGEYKDHSLSFIFANGERTSVTSGVFPALVSNSGLISSVILFLAALAGLRIVMGGGDK